MPRITIMDREYEAEKGTLVKECLMHLGVPFPCGGNGMCGKCRVSITGVVNPLTEQEKQLLSDTDISKGIRLACFARIQGDCGIQILPLDCVTVSAVSANVEGADGEFSYGVAIDVGTTTVVAALYDGYGHNLAEASAINPQISFGADVITRAQAAAMGKSADLSTSICRCINDLLCQLSHDTGADTEAIQKVVITGNTAMLCMLIETPVDALLCAPFQSYRLFGEMLSAPRICFPVLSAEAQVYLPRCIDAFLGADFVCAMGAVGLTRSTDTALMVDVGTNGEMALWHNGQLYACSTAAGPAFEGVGISCGMVAAQGAIDRVKIANQSLVYHTIGGTAPIGICGSGLIDLVACLRDLDELDSMGAMMENEYPLCPNISLTREDIHAFLVSKSAIRSGMETLCHAAGVPIDAVQRVYVAGNFGSSLNLRNAVRTGLFCREWEGRIIPVGNAALKGASQRLFDQNDDMPAVQKVELATDAYFADAFIRNMVL